MHLQEQLVQLLNDFFQREEISPLSGDALLAVVGAGELAIDRAGCIGVITQPNGQECV
jgi:hypothetical protein